MSPERRPRPTADWGSGQLTLQTDGGAAWNITTDASLHLGTTGEFDNAGLFEKTGGTGDSVINGGTLNNTGDIDALSGRLWISTSGFNNGGSIEADGGTLIVQTGVSGTGSAAIDHNGILQFRGAVSATQTVDFEAGHGMLDLWSASTFAGLLDGFASGDVLRIHDITAKTAIVSGSTLEISAPGAATYDFSVGTPTKNGLTINARDNISDISYATTASFGGPRSEYSIVTTLDANGILSSQVIDNGPSGDGTHTLIGYNHAQFSNATYRLPYLQTLAGVVHTVGGTDSDTINGNSNSNAIDGGRGNDVLNGGGGDDILTGGPGKDTIDGGAGIDTAFYGDKSVAVVVTLNGSTPATVTIGGVAEDTIRNIENVTGGSGDDSLTGDGLANLLIGGDGNDSLIGGAGRDTLIGGAGTNTLDGGTGTDTAVYSDETEAVAVALNGSTFAAVTVGGIVEDMIRNVENVTGGSGNDTLTGDGLNNVLIGGLGDDTLSGGGGDDTLTGGPGADALDGGTGIDTADYSDETASVAVRLAGSASVSVKIGGVAEDTLRSIENVTGGSGDDTLTGDSFANVLMGGAGNDTLSGRGGADTLDGGLGIDTAVYSDKTTAVVVTLNGSTATTVTVGGTAEDTIRAIENVTGGSGDDMLTGDNHDNVLVGGIGSDTLKGGAGNDTLVGGDGNDTLDGGTGIDTALYTDKTAAVSVTLNGSMPVTVTVGGSAEDTLSNIENVTGGSGDDSLTGDGLGNTLVGGAGTDTISGGAGKDTLVGGLGADTLSGQTGADTFQFVAVADSTVAAHDTILGFAGGDAAGHDVLAFQDSLGLTTVDSPLAGTTIAAGHVGWKEAGGETVVYANTSGSVETLGSTNMEIHLAGTGLGLTNNDFLLHA